MSKKLEFISAVQIFSWGSWLLLPLNSFASSNIFNGLSALASEWIWGSVAFLVGSIWLISKNLRIRTILSIFSIAFWLFISLTYMFGNFMSTATVVYPTLILIAAMAFNEINKEAKWMLQP